MKLYSFFHPRQSASVSITARFAKVEFTQVVLTRQELKAKEYTSKCPTGKAPFLQTEQGGLFETTAILRHLARSNPEAGLYGANNWESAQVDQWLGFTQTSIRPCVHSMLPQIMGMHPPNAQLFNASNDELKKHLRILNSGLQGGKSFLVGNRVSIADIYAASQLSASFQLILDAGFQKAIPHVMKWFQGLVSQSEFVESLGRVKLAKKPMKPDFSLAPAPAAGDKKQKKGGEEKKKEEAPQPEKKKVNPLDLIETKFDLFDFKTELVNSKDKSATIDKLFETYDKEAFSFYHLVYDKAEGEGEKLFMTSNLVGGFLQRFQQFRKYTIGVHGVYGKEPKLEIQALYFWKGTGVPAELTEHVSGEYYAKNKLDPTNEEHRKLIKEFWCNTQDGQTVRGMEVQDARYFK